MAKKFIDKLIPRKNIETTLTRKQLIGMRLHDQLMAMQDQIAELKAEVLEEVQGLYTKLVEARLGIENNSLESYLFAIKRIEGKSIPEKMVEVEQKIAAFEVELNKLKLDQVKGFVFSDDGFIDSFILPFLATLPKQTRWSESMKERNSRRQKIAEQSEEIFDNYEEIHTKLTSAKRKILRDVGTISSEINLLYDIISKNAELVRTRTRPNPQRIEALTESKTVETYTLPSSLSCLMPIRTGVVNIGTKIGAATAEAYGENGEPKHPGIPQFLLTVSDHIPEDELPKGEEDAFVKNYKDQFIKKVLASALKATTTFTIAYLGEKLDQTIDKQAFQVKDGEILLQVTFIRDEGVIIWDQAKKTPYDVVHFSDLTEMEILSEMCDVVYRNTGGMVRFYPESFKQVITDIINVNEEKPEAERSNASVQLKKFRLQKQLIAHVDGFFASIQGRLMATQGMYYMAKRAQMGELVERTIGAYRNNVLGTRRKLLLALTTLLYDRPDIYQALIAGDTNVTPYTAKRALFSGQSLLGGQVQQELIGAGEDDSDYPDSEDDGTIEGELDDSEEAIARSVPSTAVIKGMKPTNPKDAKIKFVVTRHGAGLMGLDARQVGHVGDMINVIDNSLFWYGLSQGVERFALRHVQGGELFGEIMAKDVELQNVFIHVGIQAYKIAISEIENEDGTLTQEGEEIADEAAKKVLSRFKTAFDEQIENLNVKLPTSNSVSETYGQTVKGSESKGKNE